MDQGTLTLNQGGALLNSGTGGSAVTSTPGATLILDNNNGGTGSATAINMANRLASTAAVTLNGGTLQLYGASGVGLDSLGTNQTIGTLTLNSGNSTVQTISGNLAGATSPATVTLTVASFVRNAGATASFLGTLNALAGTANSIVGTPNLDSAVNRITILSGVSSQLVGNNGGILPFATANAGATIGGDFATYDVANNSIAPFGLFSGYVTPANLTGNGGDIVKLNAVNWILTANTTIAGLLLTGGATVAENGFTLTVAGGILNTSLANVIIGGTLAIGSNADLVVNAIAGSTLNLNATITGSGGLTFSGAGAVTLPNANTYAGPTTLNGGGLTQTVTLTGGGTAGSFTLSYNGQTTVAIAFNASAATVQADLQALSSVPPGGVQVTGAAPTFIVTSLQNPLFLVNNSLTGGAIPSVSIASTGFNLSLGNNNSLGAGTAALTLTSGSIQALAGVTISNPLTFNNSFVNIGGNNNLTFAGPITLSDTGTGPNTFTNTLNITSTGLTTFAGSITGAGSLWLTGSGYGYLSQTGAATVAFTGAANSYTGNTYLNGPTVVAGSNNAFGTGTLTLTSGTLLAGSAGASLGNSNVVLNGSLTVPVVFGGSSIGNTASTTSTSSTSSLTFSGATTLATPTFVQVMNNTTFSNTISGPGGLVVAGPGNLSLLGANNYYGGTVLNSAGGGVVASFYSNVTATADTNAIVTPVGAFNATPTATRIDPDINYPTVAASLQGPATPGNPAPLPPGVTLVTVAMLVNGYVNIVTPGNYTFTLINDDGASLLIDGIVAVNDDATNATGTSVAMTLSAGLHTLQERMVNNGTGGGNVIEYAGPDTNGVTTVIPTSAFASAAGTAGTLTVGTGTSLGAGFVSLSNGVLSASNGVTIANTVTLAGGPLPVVLAGSAITFSSPTTLGGNVALSVNNTTTLTNDLAGTSSLTLTNQPVVVGGTTYTGASGNLVISGTPVSTSAAVTVGAGTLTVSGNGALPNIAAVNAVQTIAITKVASGTFQLTFNGQTTAPITYTNTAPGTATAAAIQSALQLLPAIGANVIVTALPTSTGATQYFTVTFIGAWAVRPSRR